MQRIVIGTLGLAGLAFAGCVTDEPEIGETSQGVELGNGVSLNGVSLNGVSLNGVSLNGVSLNGVSLNGVSLNGVSLNGVSLNGVSLNGATLTGSTWTGTLSTGASLSLRIDSVTQGSGTNSDVGMYGISYQGDTGWTTLCGVDALGAPILALAVPGVWNTQSGVAGGGAYTASATQFTLACRAKTIAKCVELGYKTWKGNTSQLTSCVRLLRGDYCGDGTPGTVTGTAVNLYDNVGIQADTVAWVIDAEWTPNGARCVSTKGEARFELPGVAQPVCVTTNALKETKDCGTSFAKGAVLIDEVSAALFN
jgi:hypothetical protein